MNIKVENEIERLQNILALDYFTLYKLAKVSLAESGKDKVFTKLGFNIVSVRHCADIFNDTSLEFYDVEYMGKNLSIIFNDVDPLVKVIKYV